MLNKQTFTCTTPWRDASIIFAQSTIWFSHPISQGRKWPSTDANMAVVLVFGEWLRAARLALWQAVRRDLSAMPPSPPQTPDAKPGRCSMKPVSCSCCDCTFAFPIDHCPYLGTPGFALSNIRTQQDDWHDAMHRKEVGCGAQASLRRSIVGLTHPGSPATEGEKV